ncbi:hypothetical protein SCUP234_07559 [Seiridium cupressi]
MSDPPKDSGVSLSSFFTRRKLPPNTRDECDRFVDMMFPSEESRPAPFQGYCSYTVMVGRDRVVQFRPPDHGLDMKTAWAACHIFEEMAPETEFLGVMEQSGLHIYSMKKMDGVSLSDLRSASSILQSSHKTKELRRQVVVDFASLQATSWSHRRLREAVPEKGVVGSSIHWRLGLLESRLPDRFKKFASSVHQRLEDIESFPWVLSHGDLIPANILVCPETGRILGLLDWAEAEWLPFGTGLYGLEELLGEETDGHFEYYSEARQLRALFWSELLSAIPALSREPQVLETIRQAQILGILFWHGIAFDDGKLDRVVEESIDDQEIQRLDTFLLSDFGLRQKQTLWEKWQSSRDHIRRAVVSRT